ncbi:hypothetical protein ES707_07620 [subsurface metagenome]|jgi:hypothetical protein
MILISVDTLSEPEMGRWEYVNDLDTAKVEEFIKQSLKRNPDIEFTTGPKMSREPGKVGLYYRIKDGLEFYELIYLAPNL